MIPWAFLIVTVIGALFTLNAYVPQRRTGPFIIPSFFAGWLTGELALHHVAWQVLVTGVFIVADVLDTWQGGAGIAISLISWSGLIGLHRVSLTADRVSEAALVAELGPGYRSEIRADSARGLEAEFGPPTYPINPFGLSRKDVRVTRDVHYVEDAGPRNRLDIYQPAESNAQQLEGRLAPVLLQIHGGGWVIGNKREQALPLMNHMAAKGWVCVATNYRLSPNATFPDHLIDLKRAIRWIRNEIQGFGGDPNFIAATGGSAGGHLSSLVGLTANDPEYQPGFEDVDTSMRAVVPFYGVYDFSDHHGLHVSKGMKGFIERVVLKKKFALEPEAFHRASPMHTMHTDAPPFFIIHGTNDGLAPVEEARHFAQSLRRVSKAPVVYAEIPGAQHAFEIFHSTRTSAVVRATDRFLSWAHSGYLGRP